MFRIIFFKIDRNLLLLLGLPLLLLFFTEDWLFLETQGYIDPWVYFGYFLNLKSHFQIFGDTYYSTRLPWILPGFLAYHFFSPLKAVYILHLAFYYASIISLYQILKRLVSAQVSLLTTLLMGSYYFFLLPIGSNYIDGAGITYLLLILLVLTPSNKGKHIPLRLCLAGVFYGCLIYTQLFLITYTPLLIFYYFFINPPPIRLQWIFSLGWFFIGFAILTLLLSSINYALKGTPFFFTPVLKWTSSFLTSGINPWWKPLSKWWKEAIWLLLPFMVCCGSIITLIYQRITRLLPHRRVLLFFQIYFILNILLHVAWEWAFHQPVLSLSYYASYLIPALFLALGSQIAIAINILRKQAFYLLTISILAICCLSLSFSNYSTSKQLVIPYFSCLSILLGIGGLITIITSLYHKTIGVFLLSISIGMLNICGIQEQNWCLPIHDRDFQKKAFLSITESVKTLNSLPIQKTLFFWYSSDNPLSPIFRSIASTYLWGYRLISAEFPNIQDNPNYHIPALNDLICIISEDSNVIEEANQRLAKIGLQGELFSQKKISHNQISYRLTFIKISLLKDLS